MWRPGWNISDFLTQGVTALIITALGNTRINPKNLHIEFAHWMFPSPITPRPWKCLFSEQTNWNLGFSHIKPFYELEGTMPLGILCLLQFSVPQYFVPLSSCQRLVTNIQSCPLALWHWAMSQLQVVETYFWLIRSLKTSTNSPTTNKDCRNW